MCVCSEIIAWKVLTVDWREGEGREETLHEAGNASDNDDDGDDDDDDHDDDSALLTKQPKTVKCILVYILTVG